MPMLGIIAFTICSCQSNSNSSTTKNAVDSLNKKATEDQSIDVSDSTDEPSPIQPILIFKNAGLVYMSGITNLIKETYNYNSSFSQEINMGIYGADLTYCMLNKQSQQAVNYLKALQSLADKLGFGNIFDSKIKRYRNNINSDDSVTYILADIQMESGNYLKSKHQKYITTIVFVGAWVEGMYIGSKVYDAKKDDHLRNCILEQMNILGNLIRKLDADKSHDTNTAQLISPLKTLQSKYNGFDEVKKYNPDSEEPIKLTDTHIAELSKEIQDLREKVINF